MIKGDKEEKTYLQREETIGYYRPWYGSNYEYKSQRTLFGLPLIHINLGRGKRQACGIIAVGKQAKGIIAVVFFAIGTNPKDVRVLVDTSVNHDFSSISRTEVERLITEEFPRLWNWVKSMVLAIFTRP